MRAWRSFIYDMRSGTGAIVHVGSSRSSTAGTANNVTSSVVVPLAALQVGGLRAFSLQCMVLSGLAAADVRASWEYALDSITVRAGLGPGLPRPTDRVVLQSKTYNRSTGVGALGLLNPARHLPGALPAPADPGIAPGRDLANYSRSGGPLSISSAAKFAWRRPPRRRRKHGSRRSMAR